MAPQQLQRAVGLFGAVMLGLGSIIGTGVFVSIGLGAGATGASVVVALVLAAVVATCNGLSSAQLAAAHPVSGGTYAYGYRYLTPWLGFAAGWTFLLAKTASAATAALGFSGYALGLLGAGDARWLTPLALAGVVALTTVVLLGVRRSNQTNIGIVSLTLLALGVFVIVAALRGGGPAAGATPGMPFLAGGVPGLLEAAALMFVAYTGYGRIATMGEEVVAPRRTIPRAMIITLLTTLLLYVAVTWAALRVLGAPGLADATADGAAPLEVAARALNVPWLALLVAGGAVTAMLGVLLNLILGLSRVVLAMGRQGDMPLATARLDAQGRTPWVAVLGVGVAIAALALVVSVRATWSFSAVTVLLYYSITNLAALRQPANERIFPRWVAVLGLVGCLSLAVWVDASAWLAAAVMLVVGVVWRLALRAFGGRGTPQPHT